MAAANKRCLAVNSHTVYWGDCANTCGAPNRLASTTCAAAVSAATALGVVGRMARRFEAVQSLTSANRGNWPQSWRRCISRARSCGAPLHEHANRLRSTALDVVTAIGAVLLITSGVAMAESYGGTAPHIEHRAGDATSFKVIGPGTNVTGDPVILTLANRAEGYKIITDNPLPSSWVGDYKLSATTRDGNGASATREWTITYAPATVPVVTAAANEIWIPGVQHSFRNGARLNPLTTDAWKLPNGVTLGGTHEMRVSMHKDSNVSLVIAGVRINPGDVGVPIGSYDFSTASGKLSLPMMAADDGREGQARLWITTVAPNSPGVDLRVNTWVPHVAMKAESWSVRQAFDMAKLKVEPVAGNRCELTSSRSTARSSDALAAPKCLVEWEPLPTDLKPVTALTPMAEGRMWVHGAYDVGYKISLVDPNDVQVRVASGTATLTVTPIGNLLAYQPQRSSDRAYRLVQPLDVMLKQSAGPACDTYWSYEGAEYRSSDAVVRCALTWTALPNTLSQDQYWVRPYLKGALEQAGTQEVRWKVDVITPLGSKIPAGEGSFAYNVIEPPVPAITEDMLTVLKDGLYAVSRDGGYAGNSVIKGANAVYRVSVVRGGEVIEDGEFDASPWGETREIQRRLNAVEAELWSRTPWTVKARYSQMPDNKSERTFELLAVPNANIKPVVTVPTTFMLDTQDLPVAVGIRDVYKQEAGYNAETMGVWEVRLVKYIDYQTTEPLTEFVSADNGDVSFTLPEGTFDTGYVRLTAEARVKSPVPEYSRTEFAIRPLNLTVVKGGAIGAGLTARRITGEAPLTSIFSLALDHRLDATALGTVTWQVSADGGSTWSVVPPMRNNKMRLSYTFPKGEYDVRAVLQNKFSGAEHTTDPIHVIAYDVPQGKLDGPEHVFLGGNGHYKLLLTHKGEPVTDEQVSVEWSLDAGKSFTPGKLEFNVTRNEPERMVLVARARMLDAPADDPFAWRELRRRVNFVPVRPPMIRIVGPARVEYPQTGTFRGVMGLPYRNMDVELRGWWTLPDGTRVDGPLLTWGPTSENLAADTVTLTYHAEIVGFDGTLGSEDKRVRVWEYVWPEFSLEPTRSSQYAPADVTVRLRQIGRPMQLDNPTYNWTLPPAATLLEDANQTMRVVRTETPGAYPFSASVSDARGNSSTVTTTVNMLAAPNYNMTLAVSPSNPYYRAPLDLTLKPSITGGHPSDRITSLAYYLNGAPTGPAGSYSKMSLGEGTHTVEARAKTLMGWSFGATQTVTVVANTPPRCTATMREWTSGWIYYADCRDDDGRIVGYRWTLDGEPVSFNSNRISVSKLSRSDTPLVTLRGVDDSGAESPEVTAGAEVEPPEVPPTTP